MIHPKKRACIERGAFDSKLDAFVPNFAHDSDDCDAYDDNGCVNVGEVSVDYFYVVLYLHHFRVLNGN